MSFKEASEMVFEGFKGMLLPLAIIIASFMLKEVNDQLGLTGYVIDAVKPYMNGAWLPALTFLVVALLGFFTGANWGTWAIALPIVIPLAQAAGVNMLLVLGSMWAAGGFGSHACPWGMQQYFPRQSVDVKIFSILKHSFLMLPWVREYPL